jgi:hypothetical protein
VSPLTLYRIHQEVSQKLVPLVLIPSGDGKVEALVVALKSNYEWVEAKVMAPASFGSCYLDDNGLGSIVSRIYSWKLRR